MLHGSQGLEKFHPLHLQRCWTLSHRHLSAPRLAQHPQFPPAQQSSHIPRSIHCEPPRTLCNSTVSMAWNGQHQHAYLKASEGLSQKLLYGNQYKESRYILSCVIKLHVASLPQLTTAPVLAHSNDCTTVQLTMRSQAHFRQHITGITNCTVNLAAAGYRQDGAMRPLDPFMMASSFPDNNEKG